MNILEIIPFRRYENMKHNTGYEVIGQFEDNNCVYKVKHPSVEDHINVTDYHRYIAEVLYHKNKESISR